MMFARLTLAAFLLACSTEAPLAAQTVNDRVLMIYGNDKCPAGTICVRGSESERYRIPKTIRDNTPSTTINSQRSLAASTAAVSASGIGSCSTTGPGGSTGCFRRDMQAARAQRQADQEAAPTAPNR